MPMCLLKPVASHRASSVSYTHLDVYKRQAFHLHGPCREDELRQIQQLGKGELLLGLAQARSIFPLIIDLSLIHILNVLLPKDDKAE